MIFAFKIKSKKVLYSALAVLLSGAVAIVVLLSLNASVGVDAYYTYAKDAAGEEKKFIKWVDFNIPYSALNRAVDYQIRAHADGNSGFNWIELLACLGTKYGGNWKNYKSNDMYLYAGKLLEGDEPEVKSSKYFSYYMEAYDAILHEFVGEYKIGIIGDDGEIVMEPRYGLRTFNPIAEGFGYSHYDDFGNARGYGYNRKHLGHDMMGRLGSPIIAVESGTIAELGWNQYGGWRIGIRSFDSKRYYYYAHLRQGSPYASGLAKGDVVTAGDVIGHMGRTGYSAKEDVNNINVVHLHFGMQLIFDPSQEDGDGEIWIDAYQIVKLLEHHRATVVYNAGTKQYTRKYAYEVG